MVCKQSGVIFKDFVWGIFLFFWFFLFLYVSVPFPPFHESLCLGCEYDIIECLRYRYDLVEESLGCGCDLVKGLE